MPAHLPAFDRLVDVAQQHLTTYATGPS
jgi:hypothetical protein